MNVAQRRTSVGSASVLSGAVVASLLSTVSVAFRAGAQDSPPYDLRKELVERAVNNQEAQGILRFEPARLDFGEVPVGETHSRTVVITNISDHTIRIATTRSSCVCTVPSAPEGDIAPGASVEVEVEFTAKNPGTSHTVVNFFLADEEGRVSLRVSGVIPSPIVATPETYPFHLESDLEVTLTASDGRAFSILSVDPPVIDGVVAEAGVAHPLRISAAKLEQAGARRLMIRLNTDHPKMPQITLRSDRVQASEQVIAFHAWANGSGDVSDIARFIEEGLDVDDADPQGRSALMFAALQGDVERVRALLEFGADVARRTLDERTALMHAAQGIRGDPHVIEVLLDAGADINASDKFDRSALYWASRGDPARVRMLIEYGADVNQQGPSHETPLMAAVKVQRIENIRAILEAGPDVWLLDARGVTALDHARAFLDRAKTEEMRATASEIVQTLESASH